MPQSASLGKRILAATPSYLYPHARPPGTPMARRAVGPAAAAGQDAPAPAPLRARAVIGNALRLPAVWCDFGACIERFSHPDALGMHDVRARAGAAGWRQDAFGLLACPRCQQTDPAFRATHPVVPRC